MFPTAAASAGCSGDECRAAVPQATNCRKGTAMRVHYERLSPEERDRVFGWRLRTVVLVLAALAALPLLGALRSGLAGMAAADTESVPPAPLPADTPLQASPLAEGAAP